MAEQLLRVSDEIELCYETFGERGDPPLLLIMGLATQMIGWPDDFCRELAARGLHVVRFDNRDSGRSTHIDAPPPTPRQLIIRDRKAARYRLADMADDAAGLLRGLELAPAHIVGASMGGMIAQTLVMRHPELARSLTSIMSNTGSRVAGQPALSLYPMFLRRPARGREASIARTQRVFKLIGSTGLPQDTEEIRVLAERSWERDHDAAAPGRQLGAILTSGNRTKDLRRIAVPTTIIHGSADKLVRPSGARATAKAIPNSRLVVIEGMGHDLPRAAWPQIEDAIVANVERADGRAPAQPSSSSVSASE